MVSEAGCQRVSVDDIPTYLDVVQGLRGGGVGRAPGARAVHHGDHGEAETGALGHHGDIAEMQEEGQPAAEGTEAGDWEGEQDTPT